MVSAPAVTINAGRRTVVKLTYEYLKDDRVSDRGLPSFQNRPADLPVSTYVGDPSQGVVRALVNDGRSWWSIAAAR